MYNGKLMLICACEATLKEQKDEERWGASQHSDNICTFALNTVFLRTLYWKAKPSIFTWIFKYLSRGHISGLTRIIVWASSTTDALNNNKAK